MSRKWNRSTDPGVAPENKDGMNSTLNSADGKFFISYIADMALLQAKFKIKPVEPEIENGAETSLVVRYAGILGLPNYFNLSGDHRKQYEELIDRGLTPCLLYWAEQMRDNLENKSKIASINCPKHGLHTPADYAREVRDAIEAT